MKDRLKTRVSYLLVGVILACGIVSFVLDSVNSTKPQIANLATGRIIPVTIRLHGTVFLTAQEYEPYRWLVGAVIVCAVFIFLIHIGAYIKQYVPSNRR